MTTFQDGPAHGVTLMLRRAPYFLRVTHDGNKYDALDQPTDSPRADETLHLYRITARPSACHIRAKNGGGFYAMANYAFVTPQPPDAILRDNEAYAKWCGEQTDDMKRWAEMLDAQAE
jgi:hypothetical protein